MNDLGVLKKMGSKMVNDYGKGVVLCCVVLCDLI